MSSHSAQRENGRGRGRGRAQLPISSFRLPPLILILQRTAVSLAHVELGELLTQLLHFHSVGCGHGRDTRAREGRGVLPVGRNFKQIGNGASSPMDSSLAE